jgi:hypothetical protein
MLAGEGEAAVAEAEQPALLVVDEGRVAPAYLPVLDLLVVEEPGRHLSQLRLAWHLYSILHQNCKPFFSPLAEFRVLVTVALICGKMSLSRVAGLGRLGDIVPFQERVLYPSRRPLSFSLALRRLLFLLPPLGLPRFGGQGALPWAITGIVFGGGEITTAGRSTRKPNCRRAPSHPQIQRTA